jgi:hypothetical protein
MRLIGVAGERTGHGQRRWCRWWLIAAACGAATFGVVDVAIASASGWSIQQTPALPADISRLAGVSCTSRVACIAVGAADGTLAERWDGRTWSLLATPSGGGGLESVSCSSIYRCVAVGGGGESWDGFAWSPQAGPTQGGLTAVSCPSAGACIAVGSDFEPVGSAGSLTSPVAAVWKGGRWFVTHISTRGGWVDTALTGVSCRSAGACTAVGAFDVGDGCEWGDQPCIDGALVERWNGKRWSIQAVPRLASWTSYGLAQVSCPSLTSCFAIGTFNEDDSPFAAHWNGHAWSSQPMPKPRLRNSPTGGLSCTSSDACTAVWSFTDGGVSRAPILAERWNGRHWTIQPMPLPPGERGAALLGLSCTSRTACTAVGDFTDSAGREEPLVERSS